MDQPIQLAGGAFDSLEAMMRAHAEAAVRLAANDHGMTLDYSPESVARLETVLAARIPVPEAEIEKATLLWGGYFGEVFRRKYPAEWIMAVYPGQTPDTPSESSAVSMPALDVDGSHIYPLLKIARRLTLGPAEDVAAFYAKVAAALDARGKQAPQRD
ncbi:MAG TPA: hypothetical protein VHX60_03120 [Acidobacteriaceae bacterium]|jgi:hypothetical protein|nr:hypothetical protein [Acidobacteriaceae bacterium]